MLRKAIFIAVAILMITMLAYGIMGGEPGETLFNGAML